MHYPYTPTRLANNDREKTDSVGEDMEQLER